MSMVDGKPTSRSGTMPVYGSLNSLMTQARALDDRAHLETIEAVYSDYLLMLVEYANKDLQSVMLGACNMQYNATDQLTGVISPTQITVPASIGQQYVIGQTITIGTTAQGGQRTETVVIKSITINGDKATITLDSSVPNMAAGDYISSRPWRNGATDGITASSGTLANDGKHPCIWRGKVDPWADAFSCLCNVLAVRRGSGTTADPYTYRLAYLPDPYKYTDGAVTADYIEANYELSGSDGYIKTISSDSRYPYLIGATEVGATPTTYAAAYYYSPRDAVCAVRIGGHITYERACSPVYYVASNTPSTTGWSFRARLFVS